MPRYPFPSSYFTNIADLSDGVADAVDETSGEPLSGYDSRYQYNYGLDTVGPNGGGKYPLAGATAGQGHTYFYMRMAEVYLIHAEAEARRQGGSLSSALGSLNAVRDRANMELKVLSDKSTLLEDILEEKLLELFLEDAETWYDFVRYDRIGDINISDYKSTITSESQLIFPLPLAATAGNELLVPNP